jgi:hypothetical protein
MELPGTLMGVLIAAFAVLKANRGYGWRDGGRTVVHPAPPKTKPNVATPEPPPTPRFK